MRRSLIFLVTGALAVMAVGFALRALRQASSAAVTSLLPRETIAFLHLPDINRTRDEWHRSDIYQLYADPAVQEFLRKPLASLPRRDSFSKTAQQIEQLDPKDAFVALTSMADNNAKVVAGFRFRGNRDAAEQIIGGWRSQLLGTLEKRETVDYQQHKIDIYGGFPFSVANSYDHDWFFASNDVDEIKALLDRADGRVQDPKSLLNAEETFQRAAKEVPSKYALGLYVQPKSLAEKIAAMRSAFGQDTDANQQTIMEQVRSIYATTRFDNGKIHDVVFVGMPKLDQDATLDRESLALGTPDTFLFIASLLNLSKQFALLNPSNAGTGVLGGGLQKIGTILARANIDAKDWDAAFGGEVGVLADWAENAHWPSGVAAFPVKDAERAKRLATVLARASDEDAIWNESDRDGVHYITMQSAPGFLVLRPTIAVSNRMMVVGLDPGSVETAIRRGENSADGLGKSNTYKNATGLVPKPTNFFAYVDLAKLYTRLDATVRPILMMWAAFAQGVNDRIDLTRMPSPEVITKHLSPIVSSQRFNGSDGYVAESIGPITLNQSGLALLALGVVGYRNGLPSVFGGALSPLLPVAPANPSQVPHGGPLGKGHPVPSSPPPAASGTP